MLGAHEFEDPDVSEKDWRRMVKDADSNGDGEIDFEEFLNMMNHHLNKLKKQRET